MFRCSIKTKGKVVLSSKKGQRFIKAVFLSKKIFLLPLQEKFALQYSNEVNDDRYDGTHVMLSYSWAHQPLVLKVQLCWNALALQPGACRGGRGVQRGQGRAEGAGGCRGAGDLRDCSGQPKSEMTKKNVVTWRFFVSKDHQRMLHWFNYSKLVFCQFTVSNACICRIPQY